MAMHKAIDLQKGGWIRVGSVKFGKWLLDVGSRFWSCFEIVIGCSFISCINRWIKNERINIIHFMGEGYICYEWGVVHANQTIVIYASYNIQGGHS